MSNKQPTNELLKRYLNGTCTDAERNLVDDWYQGIEHPEHTTLSDRDIARDLNQIQKKIRLTRRAIPRWLSYSAAATVLIAMGILLRLTWAPEVPSEEGVGTPMAAEDILPGADQATLTLADGRVIRLDEAHRQPLNEASGTYIIHNAADGIRYDKSSSPMLADILKPQYHTLATPIGKQIQLTLPDGSTVWLNARSSLTYAINSFENTRTVRLIGEAYFEVVSNAAKPFRVITDNQTVTVLGTKFNVNSYPDESGTTTTLVSGKVDVSSSANAGSVQLAPGQQVFVDFNGTAAPVTSANIDAVVAWTKGLFKFEGHTIDEVLRQLGRWYDVDIIFEGDKPSTQLWGEVHRNAAADIPLKLIDFFNFTHEVSRVNGKPRITIFNNQKGG